MFFGYNKEHYRDPLQHVVYDHDVIVLIGNTGWSFIGYYPAELADTTDSHLRIRLMFPGITHVGNSVYSPSLRSRSA